VREVARERNVSLCDLAAEVDALPLEEARTLFKKDGIHFAEPGNERVGEILYRCLERDGLLPQDAASNTP